MISLSKPFIGEEEVKAVVKVLRSGQLSQGEITLEFERKFAKYCGMSYAVAFSNATAAIHTALHALDTNEGGEVITTPFTFVASANPILMMRAKVVFADISEDDFCISPQEVQRVINNNTEAIIPVDLFGQIYDYKGLKKVVGKKKIKILEDASQAIGAEQDNIRAGNFGDVGVFSFYATKNLTTGEGGMAVTNSERLVKKMRLFRHHGQLPGKRYEYFELGYNYRMTDIAAAIGLEQLKRIDDFNKKRMKHASLLTEGLKNIPGIIIPNVKKNNKHVFHQYTIRVTKDFGHTRNELGQYLTMKGIGNGIYYPKPLHVYPHFRALGFKKGDFPVAERIANEVLSLPVNPQLTDENINTIIKAIANYAK